MNHALTNVYGSLLVVRPPVPATCNKAGANYKSEVTHLEYSPRRAYDEWLSICDAIVACGGDAVVEFEAVDDVLLDRGDLQIDATGAIRPAGSAEQLGDLRNVMTGRVFTANGPWVVVQDSTLRAVMPNMLAHRRTEASYYRDLMTRIADVCNLDLEIADNPHRWEGMADVAVVGQQVVLTYAVSGHYDEGLPDKSPRSSRAGVAFAADFVGVPDRARVYAELVYPHFHGDTVHFGARPANGGSALVHYARGLWRDESERVAAALGHAAIVAIDTDDAVEQYAGNSRQVNRGVLVPDGVSAGFVASLESMELDIHRVPLFELFGKAGGGPACTTLYLPRNLQLPPNAPVRYSVRRAEAQARRERIPERLLVDPAYFRGKQRG